ncbi:carboxymuconolactone decarboxylase family protein [[Eubacterium] cellulosolvens]
MSSAYEKGVETFSRMVGEGEINKLRNQFKSLSPDFEKLVISIIGGELYSRPNLEPRVRSLCSICALAALGRANALELNIRMAINNGCTKTDIVEALIQIAAYAGFPVTWDGLQRADKIFKDLERKRNKAPNK